MSPGEQMARMGEYAVSRDPQGRLTALGLGSCIGLALVDLRTGVAGLAHIVLPNGTPLPDDPPVKYAASGVAFLIDQVIAVGGHRTRLQAVMVGGASMFSSSSAMEVGLRNATAVRQELQRARIPVAAECTGGNRGRTLRVYVGDRRVTARVAGGVEEDLISGVSAVAA